LPLVFGIKPGSGLGGRRLRVVHCRNFFASSYKSL
jgi:hypothetical protein